MVTPPKPRSGLSRRRKGASGENLVRAVQRILPEGPTTFARRPWIEEVNELDDRLVRIRLRASVVAGREWLVEGFLSDLLKERADEGLIVHGPVVMFVDESATRRYARSQRGPVR